MCQRDEEQSVCGVNLRRAPSINENNSTAGQRHPRSASTAIAAHACRFGSKVYRTFDVHRDCDFKYRLMHCHQSNVCHVSLLPGADLPAFYESVRSRLRAHDSLRASIRDAACRRVRRWGCRGLDGALPRPTALMQTLICKVVSDERAPRPGRCVVAGHANGINFAAVVARRANDRCHARLATL